MRGSARIYDVRMAQIGLKIEKLSHIIGARGSQDLRSPSPIMAPDLSVFFCFPQTASTQPNYLQTSARPRRIPVWLVLVRGNFPVNKRA